MQHDTTTGEYSELAKQDFDAGLTKKEIEEIEEKNQDPTYWVGRRVTLATLGMDKDALISVIDQGEGEAAEQLLDSIQDYQSKLENMAELARCAEARVVIAASAVIDRLESHQ